MKRRTFLTGATGLGAVSVFGLAALWHKSGSVPRPPVYADGDWANWSGNQFAKPKEFIQPQTLSDLKNAVTRSKSVRVVGGGHSFSSLVPTQGTLINLDKFEGEIVIDKERQSAWVPAGLRLGDISKTLETHGLAFKNLGDIDVQSLAGAIGTATHGTGKNLPCLSAEVSGFKVLQANGHILTVTQNAETDTDPEIIKALQVTLGSLGIITHAQVSLRPAFKLHRKTWVEPLSSILNNAPKYWDEYRNFEFFYIPFSDNVLCISHNETEAAVTIRAESEDDAAVMELKQVRDFMKSAPRLRRKIIRQAISDVEPEDTVGVSWKLLATPRNIRFNEMEYHLPLDTALPTLKKIISRIESEHSDTFFPIEVRRTAADTAWLSPFQGGGRISIAVHAYANDPYKPLFSDIEPILKAAGGRPHWGKIHTLKAQTLSDLYPDFQKFLKLRQRFDPEGKFLSPYMSQLFGMTP